MGKFVEEHRKVLLERIQRNSKLLEELKQKDTSEMDDLNKEQHEQIVKNLGSDIQWHQETVRMIDEGKIE